MDEPRCVGLDQSARFIRSAVALQDNELLRYTVPLATGGSAIFTSRAHVDIIRGSSYKTNRVA
jgi:hypothetical protein